MTILYDKDSLQKILLPFQIGNKKLSVLLN